ncbi:hypothetical protein S83_070279, partial [Arachis hypogaea]
SELFLGRMVEFFFATSGNEVLDFREEKGGIRQRRKARFLLVNAKLLFFCRAVKFNCI